MWQYYYYRAGRQKKNHSKIDACELCNIIQKIIYRPMFYLALLGIEYEFILNYSIRYAWSSHGKSKLRKKDLTSDQDVYVGKQNI